MIDTVLAFNADEGMVDTVVVDTVGECHRRLMEEASNRARSVPRSTSTGTSASTSNGSAVPCEKPVTTVFICHDHPVRTKRPGRWSASPTGTSNPALRN